MINISSLVTLDINLYIISFVHHQPPNCWIEQPPHWPPLRPVWCWASEQTAQQLHQSQGSGSQGAWPARRSARQVHWNWAKFTRLPKWWGLIKIIYEIQIWIATNNINNGVWVPPSSHLLKATMEKLAAAGWLPWPKPWCSASLTQRVELSAAQEISSFSPWKSLKFGRFPVVVTYLPGLQNPLERDWNHSFHLDKHWCWITKAFAQNRVLRTPQRHRSLNSRADSDPGLNSWGGHLREPSKMIQNGPVWS